MSDFEKFLDRYWYSPMTDRKWMEIDVMNIKQMFHELDISKVKENLNEYSLKELRKIAEFCHVNIYEDCFAKTKKMNKKHLIDEIIEDLKP